MKTLFLPSALRVNHSSCHLPNLLTHKGLKMACIVCKYKTYNYNAYTTYYLYAHIIRQNAKNAKLKASSNDS